MNQEIAEKIKQVEKDHADLYHHVNTAILEFNDMRKEIRNSKNGYISQRMFGIVFGALVTIAVVAFSLVFAKTDENTSKIINQGNNVIENAANVKNLSDQWKEAKPNLNKIPVIESQVGQIDRKVDALIEAFNITIKK